VVFDRQRRLVGPGRSHGFVHQRAHGLGVGLSLHRRETHFAPELGIHQGDRDNAGMFDGILRKKPKPKPLAIIAST